MTFDLKFRRLLARCLSSFPPGVMTDFRHFDIFQSRGIHIKPVHFYSPIPDTSKLCASVFERKTELVGIAQNRDAHIGLLESADFLTHLAEYRAFSAEMEKRLGQPLGLGPIDGPILYHMVRARKPARIIEVGCGSSTRIIAEAVKINGGLPQDGFFTTIDPYPHAFLKEDKYAWINVFGTRLQDVPLTEFAKLGDGDLLFIDSTHVVKIDSDVVYEINEIVPRAAAGLVIHFHDIYFPYEYAREWVMDRKTFWNEQYMLQAFLAFNDAFEIMWCAGIARHAFPDKLAAVFPEFDQSVQMAGSLWMRRTSAASSAG